MAKKILTPEEVQVQTTQNNERVVSRKDRLNLESEARFQLKLSSLRKHQNLTPINN